MFIYFISTLIKGLHSLVGDLNSESAGGYTLTQSVTCCRKSVPCLSLDYFNCFLITQHESTRDEFAKCGRYDSSQNHLVLILGFRE